MRTFSGGIWAAGLLQAVAALVAIAAVSAPAGAEYYSKFGFSSDDVAEYRSLAHSIGSCRAAYALDPHDLERVDVHQAPTLAVLYGQCRKALEARRSRVQLLRVNDMFLGTQCLTIGMAGSDASSIPACRLKSYLPG